MINPPLKIDRATKVEPGEIDVVDRVLERLGLVDAPPEEDFDKYTRLVTRCLEVPVSLVSIVQRSADRQYFKSLQGMTGKYAEARQTPLSHSFCQHVQASGRPLVVEDAPNDPILHTNGAIEDLDVKAYLGVPISVPGTGVVGALCAIDSVPRIWKSRQINIMNDVAACVNDLLELRSELAFGRPSPELVG